MLKSLRARGPWLYGPLFLFLCGSALAAEIQNVNPRRNRPSRIARPAPRASGTPVIAPSVTTPPSAPANRPAPAPSRAVTPPPVSEPPLDLDTMDQSGAATPTRPVTPPSPQVVAPPAPRVAPARSTPRPAAPLAPAASSDGEIDLSTLDSPAASAPASPMGTRARGAKSTNSSASTAEIRSPHGSAGIMPNFKFYYDLVLRHWANQANGEPTLSFDSYHQRFMVEYIPYPELMFTAEIAANPLFYEVDYQLTPRLQLRFGKIWIPFDDLAPHSIFGGRINTSKLVSGANELTFLPDIWAELGVGFKYQLIDSTKVASDLHVYLTNGFQDGANDPKGAGTGGVANGEYPEFGGQRQIGADNNNDKAIGARLHTKFGGQTFGLGVSGYRNVYSDKGKSKQSMTLIGVDMQLRPSNRLETRAGILFGSVSLASPPAEKSSFTRGGLYVEEGVRFGNALSWKFLMRAGTAQADNRVIDASDKQIVGATILKRVRSLEFSLHFDRDLKKVPTKSGYNFGFIRAVAAF